MEDQKKRTLEALERRFAHAKAEVHRQQHKGKKRPISDTKRVASNTESPSVDSTLKRPSFGNFSFQGHTHKQDVEVNEPAYLKLSHIVNENLLPDGAEASDGKIIVNRVLHDILQRGDAAQKYNQGSKNLKIENNILLDNFVPKNGMPRARALHNESKRSKKHMSLKQHKRSGLFDLPKEFHKFEILKPMHDKWKAYIQQLLKIVGKDELAQCFLNADLHGAIMLGETTMEDQKKRTLEALERRFAQGKAEVHTQQHKGKKRPIADTKRVASNTESPSVNSTLKRPSFDASSKKGNFSFRGHTHKQDVEVNEPAYLKLSHTVNENLLPDGAELEASDGKNIVNRVLHDILQRGDAAQKYNQGSRNLKIENNILLDNFVPKNGMPRARALHNESKGSKKHMSLKQHKRSGLFDLPKEFHKFEIFKPMHDKWKAYIQQLLKIIGKDELAQCFLNADLHGAIMLEMSDNGSVPSPPMKDSDHLFGPSEIGPKFAYEAGIRRKIISNNDMFPEWAGYIRRLRACELEVGGSLCNHILEMMNYINRLEYLDTNFDRNLAVPLLLRSLPDSYNDFLWKNHFENKSKTWIEIINELRRYEEDKITQIGKLEEEKGKEKRKEKHYALDAQEGSSKRRKSCSWRDLGNGERKCPKNIEESIGSSS
ncbi:hypothetical protein OROMI_012094 [Orobanche minor]